MVERKTELKRRYHRKAKMLKLKAKLTTAAGPDRDKILAKIKRLSPLWTEVSAKTEPSAPKVAKEPKEVKEAKPAPKQKGPPKPKAEKK